MDDLACHDDDSNFKEYPLTRKSAASRKRSLPLGRMLVNIKTVQSNGGGEKGFQQGESSKSPSLDPPVLERTKRRVGSLPIRGRCVSVGLFRNAGVTKRPCAGVRETVQSYAAKSKSYQGFTTTEDRLKSGSTALSKTTLEKLTTFKYNASTEPTEPLKPVVVQAPIEFNSAQLVKNQQPFNVLSSNQEPSPCNKSFIKQAAWQPGDSINRYPSEQSNRHGLAGFVSAARDEYLLGEDLFSKLDTQPGVALSEDKAAREDIPPSAESTTFERQGPVSGNKIDYGGLPSEATLLHRSFNSEDVEVGKDCSVGMSLEKFGPHVSLHTCDSNVQIGDAGGFAGYSSAFSGIISHEKSTPSFTTSAYEDIVQSSESRDLTRPRQPTSQSVAEKGNIPQLGKILDEFDDELDDEDLIVVLTDVSVLQSPLKARLNHVEDACEVKGQSLLSRSSAPDHSMPISSGYNDATNHAIPLEQNIPLPRISHLNSDDDYPMNEEDEEEMLRLSKTCQHFSENPLTPASVQDHTVRHINIREYHKDYLFDTSLIQPEKVAGVNKTKISDARHSPRRPLDRFIPPVPDEDWNFMYADRNFQRDIAQTTSDPNTEQRSAVLDRHSSGVHPSSRMQQTAPIVSRTQSHLTKEAVVSTSCAIDDSHEYEPLIPFARPAFKSLVMDRCPVM